MTSESERIDRAGDYIMGRMNETERERAELDLERDPEFRETVIRLAERLRANTPEPRDRTEVWASVQESIAELPQMRDAAVLQPQRTQTRGAPEAGSPPLLGGWRGAASIAVLAAVGGAGFASGGWMAAPADPIALVRLSGADGSMTAILEIAADDTLRFLPLDMRQTEGGEVLHLWTNLDEAAGPVRLGSVARSGPTRWRGPDLPVPRAGQAYAVTATAPADAPPGLPGGTPLLEGTAEAVAVGR